MNSQSLPPPSEAPILEISSRCVREVAETIGSLACETGGIGGALEGSVLIDHFYFDANSMNTKLTYTTDHEKLNEVVRDWNRLGVRTRMMIHSHPGRMTAPSQGDLLYAARILAAIPDLEALWIPIVSTFQDAGEFRLTPWLARRNGSDTADLVRGKIRVVSGISAADDEWIQKRLILDEVHNEVAITDPAEQKKWKEKRTSRGGDRLNDRSVDAFERVHAAYDLTRMRQARVIGIGAGGAAEWYELAARSGVGCFVLFDDDVVSITNVATQQAYRSDVGRRKVECIADRIRDINPEALVNTFPLSIADVSDEEFRSLAFDELAGHRDPITIVCGFTDDFFAQARVNLLALKFGLPSICAQVYAEGRAGEITFTYPGITPACHRCILTPRYRHFLAKRQPNLVTSHGTPIFATSRLNSLKGYILLAMLHHDTDHPRWGELLKRIGNRNLIQIRLDPDLDQSLQIRVFDRVFGPGDRERILFDETVWLPQQPESPGSDGGACPDCGGTGDLRVVQIENTRAAVASWQREVA